STGPAGDATQPTVTDILPSGVSLLSHSSSQGTCAGVKTITCALGTLANGSTATSTLRGSVRARGKIGDAVSVRSPRTEAQTGEGRPRRRPARRWAGERHPHRGSRQRRSHRGTGKGNLQGRHRQRQELRRRRPERNGRLRPGEEGLSQGRQDRQGQGLREGQT